MKKLTVVQKIFTVIGLIGMTLLIPGLLWAAGLEGPVNWIESLGPAGDRQVITLVAFGLMILMFIFGGGHNISATFIGFLIGFFLISTAVDLGFMGWFKNLTAEVFFLNSPPLNYIVGLVTIFAGIMMSLNHKIPFWGELAGLVVLPIGFLVLTGYMDWFRINNNFKLSVNEGISSLTQMIDPKYQEMEEVQEYVKEVHEDEELDQDEKESKIKALKEKIKKMEEDQRNVKQLKEENERYKERLKDQKKHLKDFGWCADAKSSGKMVKSVAEAVRPGQPCVRDFAVSLVKNEAGQYFNQQQGIPGPKGLRQICALHMHLSSNWKYVNDPTVLRDDFYSPADRTIAVDLAGDCDDFGTLNASCVEAIGGISRFMAGFCAAGGHGWAEVLIGKKGHWDAAVREIRDFYNQPNMKLKPTVDENGLYWLSLDWKIGQKSCADRNLQEWYTSAEQIRKNYK